MISRDRDIGEDPRRKRKKEVEVEGEVEELVKHRVKFYEVLYDLLEKRLDLVRQGITPKFTDVRHLFYESRNVLLRTTDLNEIDSKSANPYSDFGGHIGMFCMEHCAEFGIDVDRYWLLRDKMNIYAAGKATCQGQVPKYLVDYTNRDRMSKGCSFILVCEKATVSMELLSALQKKGYKVNLVSTGGLSTNDTKEAIIQAVEGLDTENFFILVLHDYDLAGVEIFANLYKYHDKIKDVGVNKIFIDFLKRRDGFESRLVEERVTNRKYMQSVQDFIENIDMYSSYDFNYLQGEQVSPKEWIGHRIEIDAIHVQYGIQPFVDYIVDRLLDISCWDLRRIGVSEQYLDEGSNYYEDTVEELEKKVGKTYAIKLHKMSETFRRVNEIVKQTIIQSYEFVDLKNKYLGEKISSWSTDITIDGKDVYMSYDKRKVQGVEEIEKEYRHKIDKEWVDDYKDELDEEVNSKLECWEDDVTTAEQDIEDKRNEIQEKLDDDKREDTDLREFKEKLDEVNWGKDELEKIEIPDPTEEVRMVITALEKYLEELEGEENE